MGFPRTSQWRHFSWLNAATSHGFPEDQPMATFLMAKRQGQPLMGFPKTSQWRRFSWLNGSANLSWVSRRPANGDVSHGSTAVPTSHGFPEDQPMATFLMAQRQCQPLMGFPKTSQWRRFSWLNGSAHLSWVSRSPANGDVSHGSTAVPTSHGFPEDQPMATFLMAQRQSTSHGFPEDQPM